MVDEYSGSEIVEDWAEQDLSWVGGRLTWGGVGK